MNGARISRFGSVGVMLALWGLASCQSPAPQAQVAATAAALAAANKRTITGRIVYGTINHDIGETTPPTNVVFPSLPVKHVWVELNDGASLPVGDKDITDDEGRFSFTFSGTPNLTLVTKAKNDHVRVKDHKGFGQNLVTDDVLKTRVDISSRVDYGVCAQGATCDIGIVTVVSDSTDSFQTINGTFTNYISRAFYVTTAAHASGTRIESVHGATLPGEKVTVRLGISPGSTQAWYYQIDNTIYLANTDAVTVWHEYGHFVQDKIGAFALVPPYLGPGHSECSEMTDAGVGNLSPNLCWGWLEGMATWVAALNASEFYGGYSPMAAAFDADGDLTNTDGTNDVENAQCSARDIAGWTEPRAVESVVANVLWDLIDDVQDPANTTGIDEVAHMTPEAVLDVIAAPMAPHTSCGGAELNSHPMGLAEFWDEWRRQHPGVVPDLFAAYAFNGAAIGNAADLTPPGPVTLASTSHTIGGWSNLANVTLLVTDGADDVSGSYQYFVVADQSSATAVATGGTASFKSKLDAAEHRIGLPDGAGQYIHVNSRDMAGRESTGTTHIGPLNIDTVDPYLTAPFRSIPFRIDPTVPPSDPTLVLGYPTQISWGSHDDLSGVAQVRITFRDVAIGFSVDVHTTAKESGTFTWFVRDVPPVTKGELLLTVTDLAGNDSETVIPAPVVSPFSGPIAQPLGADSDPCHDGRVISADLHRDGFDDVVLVCRWQQFGHLYVFRGGLNGLTLAQDFPWRAADDLVATDLDRDGDLDVVTVSMDAPGAASDLEVLTNDGAGTLVDLGIARPLGALARKVVRALDAYDTKVTVLGVFGVLPGNVPAVLAFDVAAGLTTTVLPGLAAVAGDWETADLNADGYTDLVALGYDAASAGLSVFWGASTGWARQNLKVWASVTRANVDVGDFDSDGRPDVLTMYDAGASRVTKLFRNTGGAFPAFATADVGAHQVAQGDGYIVDTANDALAEVVAMGRTAAGSISGWYLRNDALVGTLHDTAALAMSPLSDTDTAWGDFDADGDLDVFQVGHSGTGFVIVRYENQLGTYIDQNDTPPAPSNLSAAYDTVRGGYLFSWAAPAGAGDETPALGFGYELRVGTSANGVQVLNWAHPAGASQQGQSLQRFVRMPPGVYFYDVRTVDSGWMRSLPVGVKQTGP